MKVTCSRIVRFDAGHRLYQHEGKCQNIHGHGYSVHITAEAPSLDKVGRVIDFSVLKQTIGGWIDQKWDHTIILYEKDKETVEVISKLQKDKEVFVAPFNPTAENMAKYLLEEICPKLLKDKEVKVTNIRVYETPNCYSDASL